VQLVALFSLATLAAAAHRLEPPRPIAELDGAEGSGLRG
jgi:hypothetical protein